MKVGLSAWIVVLVVLTGLPAQAVAPTILFDDFTGGSLNPDKWFGTEFQEAPGTGLETAGTEAHRRIRKNRLRITYRAYGGTGSDMEVTRSRLRLNFRNPAAVTAFKATVRVHDFETTDCAFNPTSTLARARLSGFFFYTDAAATAESDAFGVLALVEVLRISSDPAGVLKVRSLVLHCTSVTCASATFVGENDLGTTTTGTPVTLRIEWDPANDQFLFSRDAMAAVSVGYALTDTLATTGRVGKRLEVAHNVENCFLPPRRVAFMDASFDNVFVNPP